MIDQLTVKSRHMFNTAWHRRLKLQETVRVGDLTCSKNEYLLKWQIGLEIRLKQLSATESTLKTRTMITKGEYSCLGTKQT